MFSCHVIGNPDVASLVDLMQRYGPDVPSPLLSTLAHAVSDLSRLVDEGVLTYPYSTRELVNVVRHLQAYPSDSLPAVLRNVFAFDQVCRRYS